jgi:hypothetical protein
MKNLFVRPAILIGLLISMLFLIACGPDSKPEQVDKEKKADPVAPLFISGNYNYLLCKRVDFLSLLVRSSGDTTKGKGLVMFKPNLSDSGITLHGWSYRGRDTGFSSIPNLKLTVGKDTSLTFQSGSYIGGFIISWRDIRDIRAQLRSNSNLRFVFFQPYFTNASKTEIAYNIILSPSDQSSFVLKDEKNLNTGKIVRPIPPGGGSAFEE